jgi:hypothetical protein
MRILTILCVHAVSVRFVPGDEESLLVHKRDEESLLVHKRDEESLLVHRLCSCPFGFVADFVAH